MLRTEKIKGKTKTSINFSFAERYVVINLALVFTSHCNVVGLETRGQQCSYILQCVQGVFLKINCACEQPN